MLRHIKPPSGTFSVHNTRISCPHVRSLELWKIRSEVVLGQILDLVCLPSLEEWTLQWCRSPLNKMISFVESSSFGLKTFWTIGNCDDPDQIHDLLRYLPFIKVLQLGFCFKDKPPTEVLFFKLLCSPSETTFLPHLQTLKFDHDLLFSWESLSQIFSASHHQTLELEVDYHNILGVEDETAARLLELVNEGFNLRVLRDGKTDMIEGYLINRHSEREQGSIAQE